MASAAEARTLLEQRVPPICITIAEPLLVAAARHEGDAELTVADEGPNDVRLELVSRSGTRCPILCVFGRGRSAGWFALFAGEADFESGDTIENLGGPSALVAILTSLLRSRATASESQHAGRIYRAHYTFHDWLVDGEPMTLSQRRSSFFKRLQQTTREWQPWL